MKNELDSLHIVLFIDLLLFAFLFINSLWKMNMKDRLIENQEATNEALKSVIEELEQTLKQD